MNDVFWTNYSRLVAKLMPPLAPGDGVSEAEIAAAEARLGIKLPTLLREFYLVVGGRKDITCSHDRLISLDKLAVDQDVLAFYEENQGVVLWGVNIQSIGEADPKVFAAEYQPRLVWEASHEHLSEFFREMLCWQAVNGGLAYVGFGTASGKAIAQFSDDWEAFSLGGETNGRGYRVRLRGGQILFIIGNDSLPEVHGGGRTKEDFRAITKTFRVGWDYSTLDEELDEELDEDEYEEDEQWGE